MRPKQNSVFQKGVDGQNAKKTDGILSWAPKSAEWICGGFFEQKMFSDFSKAKFANPSPCAPCFSEFLDPLSWCGCGGCVLLRSHLLVLAWWWFAGWIWVSAVFTLAWRVSSARMVFGKLLVLPEAPTAWNRGESQDRGQADVGLPRHGQKQVIWGQHTRSQEGAKLLVKAWVELMQYLADVWAVARTPLTGWKPAVIEPGF